MQTAPTTKTIEKSQSSARETAYLESIPGFVNSVKAAQASSSFVGEDALEW